MGKEQIMKNWVDMISSIKKDYDDSKLTKDEVKWKWQSKYEKQGEIWGEIINTLNDTDYKILGEAYSELKIAYWG